MQRAPTVLRKPPKPTRRRRTRRRRVGRRGRITFGILAALALVGGFVLAARHPGRVVLPIVGWVAGLLQPNGVGPIVPVVAQEPISILVLSNEVAPQYAGPQLTDSMMVMTYDPKTRHAAVLSVPRDMWVDVPGHGPQRINTAYEFGGYKTVALTVEKYVGVPIEYYAIVNYTAFVDLVDAAGGIQVDVPYAINDACYPNPQENRCTHFVLSAGVHHLDGATALEFARERHSFALGDIQREKDQQLVLLALKQQLLKPQNFLKLPKIIGDLSHLVVTDIPYSALPRLAATVLNLPHADISTAVLDYSNGSVSDYTTGGGAMVLRPHEAAIRKVVTGLFPTMLGELGALDVQVENGAPTQQDYATYFSGVLRGMGAATLPPEQAARTDRQNNHVYVNVAAGRPSPNGSVALGADIVAHMLGTRVQARSVPGSSANVVVILGKAFPSISP